MKCRLCGIHEVEKEVHFKIRELSFSFSNKMNRCGKCVKKAFIHTLRMKDEQDRRFVILKNGDIQVNWSLYRKWYRDSCGYHALPIIRYVVEEMTQVLEQLGVISFNSGWNEQQKGYNNCHSGMMIDWRSIYLTRQEDVIQLWKLRQQENERDPEY